MRIDVRFRSHVYLCLLNAQHFPCALLPASTLTSSLCFRCRASSRSFFSLAMLSSTCLCSLKYRDLAASARSAGISEASTRASKSCGGCAGAEQRFSTGQLRSWSTMWEEKLRRVVQRLVVELLPDASPSKFKNQTLKASLLETSDSCAGGESPAPPSIARSNAGAQNIFHKLRCGNALSPLIEDIIIVSCKCFVHKAGVLGTSTPENRSSVKFEVFYISYIYLIISAPQKYFLQSRQQCRALLLTRCVSKRLPARPRPSVSQRTRTLRASVCRRMGPRSPCPQASWGRSRRGRRVAWWWT